MAELDESQQKPPLKSFDEELYVAKDADGEKKPKKIEESASESEKKVEDTEAGTEKMVMDDDSPSSVESCSTFREEREALRDLKANEKNRLSELKEKVAEVFQIETVGDEDEDAKQNGTEEPTRGNEEKETEVDSPSRVVEKSALSEMKSGDEDGKTKTEETEESNKEVKENNKEMEGGNVDQNKKNEVSSHSQAIKKSPSFNEQGLFKEESNFLCDLKDNERKALSELKAKVEEAILQNKIFNKEKTKSEDIEGEEGKLKEKSTPEGEEKSTTEGDETAIEESHRDVTLWGVPLLPSKGAESTNVVLLKFLRAREFNVDEALEMLKDTLRWREEYGVNSILDEDLGLDFSKVAYMEGIDHEGHPVCYNTYGIFLDEELYHKTFGAEENCKKLLRWRVQMMEREIKKLNFEPGGISSFLQINDLSNSPGPSRKELRQVMKQAVTLLQDNYPEFVSTNVFINVPFWYYALYAFISPFLTQRTKSKFVFARPAKVTETLLRYISAKDIPICYGGLKREEDDEFSIKNGEISELLIKGGSTEIIELHAPETGTTLLWDLTVLGWEVNYKEEFIPTDEKSYTLIVRKGKKMAATEEPIRNSFKIKEPGKVILTVENPTFKKKRVLYRYKVTS
ncbi:hypothetical protein AAC387_Pa06g1621 [Persea americana]